MKEVKLGGSSYSLIDVESSKGSQDPAVDQIFGRCRIQQGIAGSSKGSDTYILKEQMNSFTKLRKVNTKLN